MIISERGECGMEKVLNKVTPLPGFLLVLQFLNGSVAVVNMAQRVGTVRFAKLLDADFFATAKASGDRIIWSDGKNRLDASCDEILDIMMMD